MSNISTLELCRQHLFDATADIAAAHGECSAQRVERVRQMYLWRLDNPEAKDRAFIAEFRTRFTGGKNAAHECLAVVNQLLPMLSEKSREFHLWRYNEMILETYEMAKKREDTRTMERAATSYAKINKVDAPEEQVVPIHLVAKQPFVPTDDPTPLGIAPIPDIDKKITAMIEKYSRETIDIEDVDFEEVDLEEDELFGSDEGNNEPESIL